MRKNDDEKPPKVSFVGSLIHKYFIEPSLLIAFRNLNFVFVYVIILILITGHRITFWYALFYFPSFYFLNHIRKSQHEKIRIEIAHRLPFFADALGDALSSGTTLEQSLVLASSFLKGNFKIEFNKLMLKNLLGKNIGVLMRELDLKFPHTGLIYLISLLNTYNELGVGISPLLKRIARVLDEKEKAEEKIRNILAAGNTYANITICVFGVIFLGLSFILKNQLRELFSPGLEPIFIFLILWSCLGISLVTRLTSLDFARNFSLRPYIMKFLTNRKMTFDDLLSYSGLKGFWREKDTYVYLAMLFGFILSYTTSWWSESFYAIIIGFLMGSLISWFLMKYIIQAFVDDQLIATVEAFPDILQIFIIGLNSGLNSYLAFQFAQNVIKADAPKLLKEELCRAKLAMECGDSHYHTWRRLSENLPFDIVSDFSEIMIAAPLHGESIVNPMILLTANYQKKKLSFIEKKASSISQLVIPVIVMAFFPLFVFIMFAPILSKVSKIFT